MLSNYNFTSLTLLESHTGVLKDTHQLYTKYANGKELARIPFTKYFLEIFGDSQTFFPMDRKLRKDITDIAEKYKWTQITTLDKINYGIDQIQNPLTKAVIREMMSKH